MLNQSRVVFDPVNHTYMLDGKKLSGITGVLSKWLFPDKYKDVPQHIVEHARERGTLIHNQIHMAFEGFVPADPTEEYKAFMNLNKNFIASEYIVSDNERYATAIDLVDDEINLADIKTTYKLDKDYTAWQLSIEAYLFEMDNPGLKVKGIYAIHLKGDKAKIIPLERIDETRVRELLNRTELPEIEDNTLETIRVVEKEMARLKQQYDDFEKNYNALKEQLALSMEEKGIMTFENDFVKVSYKGAYTRKQFDSTRFKEEHPELADEYQKEVKVKHSVNIKFKEV